MAAGIRPTIRDDRQEMPELPPRQQEAPLGERLAAVKRPQHVPRRRLPHRRNGMGPGDVDGEVCEESGTNFAHWCMGARKVIDAHI